MTWVTKEKRSDDGTSKTVRKRDMKKIVCQVWRKPGKTSKSIFTVALLPIVAKSTRNTILQNIASVK